MMETNTIENITTVARSISDFGMLAIAAAAYLVISLSLMGAVFKWFRSMIDRIIKKIREENHIADRPATAEKIRRIIGNLHEDRNSKFDCYSFRGRKLSDYTSTDWIEQVARVVENEIYNTTGANNGRAYTNVRTAYDNIKLDFYHRLIN